MWTSTERPMIHMVVKSNASFTSGDDDGDLLSSSSFLQPILKWRRDVVVVDCIDLIWFDGGVRSIKWINRCELTNQKRERSSGRCSSWNIMTPWMGLEVWDVKSNSFDFTEAFYTGAGIRAALSSYWKSGIWIDLNFNNMGFRV